MGNKNNNGNGAKLKEVADDLIEQGVGSMEQFRKALPVIARLKKSVDGAKDWLTLLQTRYEKLSGLAADYAEDHVTALDEPISDKTSKVRSGSVAIDGTRYRLTLSLGDVARLGGNATEAFIAALPKDWTVPKLFLNQSYLKTLDPKELESRDLRRKRNRKWSIDSLRAE